MRRRPIDDVLTPVTCRHGGRAGRMPDGQYWCPQCRADLAAEQARAQARVEAEQARREYLRRLGWRRGRPPRDAAMRQANDDTLPD